MLDRSPPVTRFSVAPDPLLNWTEPPWPMEKLFQSMMPRALCWEMVRLPPLPAIVPEPATKPPPLGRTGFPPASAVPEASSMAEIATNEVPLNRLRFATLTSGNPQPRALLAAVDIPHPLKKVCF